MAFRMLRRVQQAQQLQQQQQQQQQLARDHAHDDRDDDDDDDDDDGEDGGTQASAPSFQLLGGEGGEEDEDGEDEGEDEDIDGAAEQGPSTSGRTQQQRNKQQSNSSRNSKQKKLTNAIPQEEREVEELLAALDTQQNEAIELPFPNRGEPASSSASSTNRGNNSHAVDDVGDAFAIDTHYLLRVQTASSTSSSSRPRGLLLSRRGHNNNNNTHRSGTRVVKKGLLVKPRETWPRWDAGVSMEFRADGTFQYVYSSAYKLVQAKYHDCMDNNDGMHVARELGKLLVREPYHVDCLLALAEIYRMAGELQQASELVERAVYSLECAWHPWFDPASAQCRMRFEVEENQPLFVALFRHAQLLCRQSGAAANNNRALEVVKLLLALDPAGDPIGARFMLDHVALACGRGDLLKRVMEQKREMCLGLFPSYSFSIAAAAYVHESRALMLDSGGDGTLTADDLLVQALWLHPYVLLKLLHKASIKLDSTWVRVSQSQLFKPSAQSATADHLADIYAERHHKWWQDSRHQAWLRRCATRACADDARVDGVSAQEWALIRNAAFPHSAHNEYEHVQVADFGGEATLVYALPCIESYMKAVPWELRERARQWRHSVMDAANKARRRVSLAKDLDEGHPLRVFLSSLLPWVDYEDAARATEVEEPSAG